MAAYLRAHDIRLFDDARFVEPLREEIRHNAERLAHEHGLKIEFIRAVHAFRQEDRIQALLAQRGTQPGLVHIFAAMEPCTAFMPWHDKTSGRTTLRYKDGKRLHYYQAVYDNLHNLGLDVLDIVNLRMGGLDRPTSGSIAEPFEALAALQQQGLITHLDLSAVSAEQIAEARSIAPVVCVQNCYNIAHRGDDTLIDALAAQGTAYVPYFPLGGFTPLQSDTLASVARRLGATPLAVALAWLLQRAPNILLIPGASSVAHLRENVASAGLTLSAHDLTELNGLAA